MANKKKPEPAPKAKVGVYVCHCGGNISDAVDVDQVCEQVRKVPGWWWPGPICSCVPIPARN